MESLLDHYKYERPEEVGPNKEIGLSHRKSSQAVAPSDPIFDRSLISDADYIELLIFESKELRGLLSQHENDLKRMEIELHDNNNTRNDFKRLENELKEQGALIKDQDIKIRQQDAEIRQQKTELRQQELDMKQRDVKIRQQEMEIKERDVEFRERDMQLKERQVEFKEKEIELKEKEVEIRDLELELRQAKPSVPSTPATNTRRMSRKSPDTSPVLNTPKILSMDDVSPVLSSLVSGEPVSGLPASPVLSPSPVIGLPVSPVLPPSPVIGLGVSRTASPPGLASPVLASPVSPISESPISPILTTVTSPAIQAPEVPVRSSRRGHIQTAEQSIYTSISNFAPNSPVSKSSSINSNLSSAKANPLMNMSIGTILSADDDSIDTSHLERVKSSSSDLRTVRSIENKNTSNSSFSSYKSRIKLPTTLQNRERSGSAASADAATYVNPNGHTAHSAANPSNAHNAHSASLYNSHTAHSAASASSSSDSLSRTFNPNTYNTSSNTNNIYGIESAPTSNGFSASPAAASTSTVASTSTTATLLAQEFQGLKSPAVLDFESYETPPAQTISQFGENPRKMPRTPDGLSKFPHIGSPQSAQSQSTESTQHTQLNHSNLNMQSTPTFQSTPNAQNSQSTQYHRNTPPTDDLLKTPSNNYSDPLRNHTPQSFNVLPPSKPEDDTNLFVKPEDFHTIHIEIVSTIHVSSQYQNKRSDDPNCTIAITDRESKKEMWRIRKTYSQLIAFDQEIRPIVEYFGLPHIPDKALFLSTTPIKIEARRATLQNYFNTIFVMPHLPHMVLHRICRYLSLDFLNPLDDYKSGARKEGFLVRRYKALGTSWKVRWCQLDGPNLEVFENPGGALLELIRLKGTQIGRQSSDSVAEDKGYRHAFLIMETQKQSKLSASFPKHFFCAETDEERDDWVDILLEYNGANNTIQQTANVSDPSLVSSPSSRYEGGYEEELEHTQSIQSQHGIQGGQTQTVQKNLVDAEDTKKKKRSIFPFRNKGTHSNSNVAEHDPLPDAGMQQYLNKMNLDEGLTKTIFGREVADAFILSHQLFHGVEIPSVLFRCLDYMTKTGAVYEEGIFRLSGSASNIRQLKDQFNTQFDMDLFESPLRPDIHTVAGLFKTYLRELPVPILGGHAYNHLNHVVLLNLIAPSNLALIFRDYFRESVDPIHYDVCHVLFNFLREVIAHSANNRMNLRNLCIVFVPTLNISLEVFSTLLVDYDCIFENADPVPDHEREILDIHIPNF